MIRITLALSIVLGAILFRFPAARYEAPAGMSVECHPLEGPSPYQTLLMDPGPRFLSRGGAEGLDAAQSYFVPPLGDGYLAYSKLGKEISYFARSGELYWKRDSASYPVSDPEGRLILLLSGDLTAVRLMDRNGNMEASAPMTGLVLTDYAFTNDWPTDRKGERQAAAAVLFASGPAYLIVYGAGVKVSRLPIPDAEKTFAKSIALADGRIAIHLGDAEGDTIRTYSVKERSGQLTLSLAASTKLPVVYPHRIAMSMVGDGVLFSAADRVGLAADAGLAWTLGASGSPAATEATAVAAPRPEFQGDALVAGETAAAGNGSMLVLTNGEGWPLAQAGRSGAFRLLPLVPSAQGRTGVVTEDAEGYCTFSASRR